MALATGVLAVTAGLGAAAPAAADYPPREPSLAISGCSDVKGGVKVKVKDLLGGSPLTVSWAPNDGSVSTTTKSNGSAKVNLPITIAGTYTVVAMGTDQADQPWDGTTSVEVLASCSDSGVGGRDDEVTGGTGGSTGGSTGGLADTGADTAGLLTAGLGALAVGGAAVAISRRRRNVQPETA